LQRAAKLARKAARSFFRRGTLTRQSLDEQRLARARLIAAP
jgi:hypothetical protein